jgi:hypothetical protein
LLRRLPQKLEFRLMVSCIRSHREQRGKRNNKSEIAMGRLSTPITCLPEDGRHVSKSGQTEQAYRLAEHYLLIMTDLHQTSKNQSEPS